LLRHLAQSRAVCYREYATACHPERQRRISWQLEPARLKLPGFLTCMVCVCKSRAVLVSRRLVVHTVAKPHRYRAQMPAVTVTMTYNGRMLTVPAFSSTGWIFSLIVIFLSASSSRNQA